MASDKIITPPDSKFKDKLRYNKLLDHAKVMAKSMVIDEIDKQNTQNRYMNSLKETGKYPNLNVGDNVRFNNPKYNNYGTKTKVKELSFEGVHPDTLKRMQKRGTAKDLIKMKGEYYRPLIVFEDGSMVDATDLKEQKVVRTVSAKSSNKPLPIMDIYSKEFKEAEKDIEQKRTVTSPTPVHKLHSIKGANFPGGKITKRFNEGGTAMKKQMEMFDDGGLKDEGGMIDEVSGNDVPSGSTREEVRDDIPAQLSEGEFVFPADVVRFIGLEKLMQMRQKAKMGLQKMEDMGQMGNSEEAIIPDDMPFSIDDLDIEEEVDNQAEMEYNKGGVVYAQQGAYIPNVGKAYQPPAAPNAGTPYAPANYGDLLGTSAGGAPKTQNVRYVNEATGQVRMIPHVLNADGTIGNSLYPRPDGFIRKEEAVIEPVKETKVQSTKVAPVDTGDDSGDQEQREREEAMYGPGGGRISLGGTIKEGTTVKTGFLGKGTSSLTKDATTFGIGYTVPGSLPGIYGALANVISIGTKGVPEGGTGKFTLGGVTLTKSAKVTNAIIKDPMGKEARNLIAEHKTSRELETKYGLSKKEINSILAANYDTKDGRKEIDAILSKEAQDKLITAVIEESKADDGSVDMDKFNSLPEAVKESYYQAEDDRQEDGVDIPDSNISQPSDSNQEDFSDYSDNNNDSDNSSGYGADSDTDSGDYEATGGLLTKRKASGKVKDKWKKKMKRGGLASR